MITDTKYPLLVKSSEDKVEYQHLTRENAGWEFLNFGARLMKEGENWVHFTGNNEMLIVLLGGAFKIETEQGTWITEKSRKDVFSGLPHAVYLPGNKEFTLSVHSDFADIAYGWCETDQDHPIQYIDPDKVEGYGIEIRGDINKAINSILDLGVEVLVVKKGADGCSVYEKGKEELKVPGFPVEILNILGAGDAFASGFIYGYLKGWGHFKAARMGMPVGLLWLPGMDVRILCLMKRRR